MQAFEVRSGGLLEGNHSLLRWLLKVFHIIFCGPFGTAKVFSSCGDCSGLLETIASMYRGLRPLVSAHMVVLLGSFLGMDILTGVLGPIRSEGVEPREIAMVPYSIPTTPQEAINQNESQIQHCHMEELGCIPGSSDLARGQLCASVSPRLQKRR